MKNYLFLLLLLATLIPFPLGAQNNPYKINDSLYTRYRHILRYRSESRCVPMADSLYAEANRVGDKKAACIALTVPVAYYLSINDSLSLVGAVRRLQEVSRQNGYLQYYYFAYSDYIIFMINKGYMLTALRLSEKMRAQALEDGHDYGLYSCLRMQGNIYFSRGDNQRGASCYRQAYEYQQKHLPEQDASPLLRYLAKYYQACGSDSLNLAMYYATKAVEQAKTYEVKLNAQMELCKIYFKLKRYDEFLKLYDELEDAVDKYGRLNEDDVLWLKAYRAMLDEDWNAAYQCASQMLNMRNRLDIMIVLSSRKGDYRQALLYSKKLQAYKDSLAREIHSSDLAEMTVQLDNMRVKREAHNLELKNTELKLRNTRTFMFSSLAFLVLLAIYLYNRHRMVISLRKNNQDLTIARDKAEQAVKIKTAFIQNMTHEIRTPLNAIVGFSQLLTTPGMQVGEEEKAEFSRLIQQNSDLLTTLVNDVLDLASLESGKYTMHLSLCRCNDVCRAAMASVQHRKAPDVEMSFTSEVNDDFELMTDGKRLQQVLINFLTNAEKFTSHGEIRVHCSLSENPGKMTFSVEDTGPGVPADKADLIFERFYKLDSFKQGSGLGLNICSAIAERLHGEVRCDKNYTKGARFLFILPLAESSSD